jgi:hypothetical protein
MKRINAVLNLIVVIAVIAWNYLSNTGKINGKTIGDVSADLDNLFTPAPYAFSIWGIIFIGLLVNGIYQVKVAFGDDIQKQNSVLTGPWLTLANIANGVWVWCWLNEYTGLSVVVMVVILLSLIKVAIDLRLELDMAPRNVIIFAWWPNTIYLGWISVALIANIAAYLSKIGWADNVNEILFTVIMILVATLVNMFVLFKRNMREFCAVGVWSLIAIAVESSDGSNMIFMTAMMCAGLLTVLTFIHAIKNRKENSI